RWFEPDIVVGVGYWGHTSHLVLHPQRYGITAIPWLVADGYMANYGEILDKLPLMLVTSNWVKKVYIRDGLKGTTSRSCLSGAIRTLLCRATRKSRRSPLFASHWAWQTTRY
ncbi:MAG: hypothetical protein WC454_02180, partial [Phycisphaerae bacterium]